MESNGTAGYGTVRPVVWEDGGGNPASYPMRPAGRTDLLVKVQCRPGKGNC